MRYVVKRPVFLNGKQREPGSVLAKDMVIPEASVRGLMGSGRLIQVSDEEAERLIKESQQRKVAEIKKVGTESPEGVAKGAASTAPPRTMATKGV